MNKITNAQNVDNYLKRKKLLICWFVSSLVTIILAVISLILNYGLKEELAGNLCMVVALCTFFVSIIFRKMREKIVVTVKEEKKEAVKTKKNKTKTNKKTTKTNKNTKNTNK